MVATIRRWVSALGALMLLASFVLTAGGAHAAEQVDKLPGVNNIATARMKILLTTDVDGVRDYTYGQGSLVTPDKQEYWLTDNGRDFVNVIQVGDSVYVREGNGPWQREAGGGQLPPFGAQLNAVQSLATAIYRIGDETVNGRATAHYQAWISGSRLAELVGDDVESLRGVTLKYDYWVGADGYLYQENSTFMFAAGAIESGSPELMSSTLITYYDINNPNISISAPR